MKEDRDIATYGVHAQVILVRRGHWPCLELVVRFEIVPCLATINILHPPSHMISLEINNIFMLDCSIRRAIRRAIGLLCLASPPDAHFCFVQPLEYQLGDKKQNPKSIRPGNDNFNTNKMDCRQKYLGRVLCSPRVSFDVKLGGHKFEGRLVIGPWTCAHLMQVRRHIRPGYGQNITNHSIAMKGCRATTCMCSLCGFV